MAEIKDKVINAEALKATVDALRKLIDSKATQEDLAAMVDSAPEMLNTLTELANALGDDPNFATTITAQIGSKADTEHTHTKSDITDFPTSMPASDVHDWAKAETKPAYTADEVKAVSYEQQTLTEEQKARVRSNIGAGDSAFSGNYNDLINTPTLGNLASKNIVARSDLSADIQESLSHADSIDLSNHYTKEETDNIALITINDIDIICGVACPTCGNTLVGGICPKCKDGSGDDDTCPECGGAMGVYPYGSSTKICTDCGYGTCPDCGGTLNANYCDNCGGEYYL